MTTDRVLPVDVIRIAQIVRVVVKGSLTVCATDRQSGLTGSLLPGKGVYNRSRGGKDMAPS